MSWDRSLHRRSACLAFTALIVLALGFGSRSTAADADPVPRDGVDEILNAFTRVPLVAVGEIHGSALEHDFLRRLITDARFARLADDLVVEFGNARYQRLVDRYVAGKPVTLKELSVVWLQTTQRGTPVWSSPVYPRFFRMVRGLNSRLSARRRLRILLGDPPIDWRRINPNCNQPETDWHRPQCIDYWYQRRESHYARAVNRHVLARGRRALLIAGGAHFFRPPASAEPDTSSLIDQIERYRARSVFIVQPYTGFAVPEPRVDAVVSRWKPDSVAAITGTWVGALPARLLFGPDEPSTPEQPRGPNLLAQGTLEERFDALLRLPD
jgi:hypothetical protein